MTPIYSFVHLNYDETFISFRSIGMLPIIASSAVVFGPSFISNDISDLVGNASESKSNNNLSIGRHHSSATVLIG
jgi:hypothetical protein